MAHPKGKKEEGRVRVLEGAARGFREGGYGGVGVDGLARKAGVTSGAFYAHFSSKAEAFREVVRGGLAAMTANVVARRAANRDWLPDFLKFYLGQRRKSELGESCTLQSLTGEVARSDTQTRVVFQEELEKMLQAFVDDGEAGPRLRRSEAMALLALLTGAVSLTRAVEDPHMKDEIAAAAEEAAIALLAE